MMKLSVCWLALFCFVFCYGADTERRDSCLVQLQENDTLYVKVLRTVYVYPPMRFKNKRQERFYWKTVRDVKKTLPIAKILTQEMIRTHDIMSKMNRREQRKFWKQYEKILYTQYEDQFRHMTAS
ncbi:MAG TPA: DUF4294 domain-containing protein, partial [Bacteroidales bacterium]|nr:DUF4294 domain-containing protein [Bacteroidales bacterium]